MRTAVAALSVLGALSACGEYEIVDLGKLESPDGFRVTTATSINNHGEIVGETMDYRTGTRGMPGYRLRDGKVEQLGLLSDDPRAMSKPMQINDGGVAVGFASKGKDHVPVIWEPGKPIRELDVQTPGEFSAARAISNSGLIAGSFYPGKYNISFLLSGGKLTALGTLGTNPKGVAASYPNRVNDKGQVIGHSSHAEGFRAFVWEGGRMRELAMLPEYRGDGARVYAYGINAAGQIVGCSGDESRKESLPVLWQPDGSIVKLGQPGKNKHGIRSGCANAINSNGVVVGTMTTADGDAAFIWDAASGLRDLNDLAGSWRAGWKRLSSANAINDRGEVIGFAEGKDNMPTEPYLLRPRR
jgi:probable HAF family extracellular repeat protein